MCFAWIPHRWFVRDLSACCRILSRDVDRRKRSMRVRQFRRPRNPDDVDRQRLRLATGCWQLGNHFSVAALEQNLQTVAPIGRRHLDRLSKELVPRVDTWSASINRAPVWPYRLRTAATTPWSLGRPAGLPLRPA